MCRRQTYTVHAIRVLAASSPSTIDAPIHTMSVRYRWWVMMSSMTTVMMRSPRQLRHCSPHPDDRRRGDATDRNASGREGSRCTCRREGCFPSKCFEYLVQFLRSLPIQNWNVAYIKCCYVVSWKFCPPWIDCGINGPTRHCFWFVCNLVRCENIFTAGHETYKIECRWSRWKQCNYFYWRESTV